MMRALLRMFAVVMLALVARPADAQTPIQSKTWMVPLQQDGANGARGQSLQLSITNLSARPAHLTFRFYNALGAPVPYELSGSNYIAGETVGTLLTPGETKLIYAGNSGMRAVFQLVLSDEPVVVSAFANRVMIGGSTGLVRAASLAFDCNGAHAGTFPCREPLTAMLPPRPSDPLLTPTPPPPDPSPGEDMRDSMRPSSDSVGKEQRNTPVQKPPKSSEPRGRSQ